MRDALISEVHKRMRENDKIFFLSDDFGAVALDKLREEFSDRFINVGIAEQNLINVSVGLALEGFIVFAYGISTFITMRPYEQLRTNLSLFSQLRELNVNLIGVGCGVSYDLSGPSHHCLEDLSIIRTLPNFILLSASDYILSRKFVDFALEVKKPKYIRLDGKLLPKIYNDDEQINFHDGFKEIIKGKKGCIISTGYMTHKAIEIAKEMNNEIGVIDVFLIKPLNKNSFSQCLRKYRFIFTLEEGFINASGLGSLVLSLAKNMKVFNLGFEDKHTFVVGSREYLHKINKVGKEKIIRMVRRTLQKLK